MKTFLRAADCIVAGIVAGALFVICAGYNPASLSSSAYIEMQQNSIRGLNTLMPVLGLIAILLTMGSAFVQKKNRNVFITLLFAAILLIVAGLVTRFGNQPINAIVMTWQPGNAPGNWIELRDKWWSLHLVRTASSIAAFCLIVWVSIRKD